MQRSTLALSLAILMAAGTGITGCSVDNAKKHYILAEKLWSDGKYAPAVNEFEKVTVKDPRGKLGLQALFRGAMTQTLFLSEYNEAVRKFRSFAEQSPPESPEAWEAQKQIGEILFARTEQYDLAIQHYRQLLKLKPSAREIPEFLFRIGKSHFFLWQFDDALVTYRDLMGRYPDSVWAEKAAYELGVTHYTRGEQHPGGRGPGMGAYQEAIEAYQSFLKTYPRSKWASLARFGIANSLEELDQLDAAYRMYESLKESHPSPNVVEIRLARIRERKAQRNH